MNEEDKVGKVVDKNKIRKVAGKLLYFETVVP